MTMPDRKLFEYLEDEVTGSERAEIEATLADSPPARRRLRDLEEMVAGLRATDDVDSIDLVGSVRAAVERTPSAPPRRWRARRWLPAASGLALAATAAVVTLVVTARPDGDAGSGEFRAKSAGSGGDGDLAVGLEAYLVEGGAPQRLVRALPQGAGLLFAYRNRSAHRHLMIFAVDQRGEVYWFYPAYEREGSNPRSIEVDTTGEAAVELPDRIEHAFAPGPLAIYALFTARAESVSAIEAIVASVVGAGWDARRPPRLPIAGSAQQVVSAEVEAP